MWWDAVLVGRSGGHWVPQTSPGMMVEQMGDGSLGDHHAGRKGTEIYQEWSLATRGRTAPSLVKTRDIQHRLRDSTFMKFKSGKNGPEAVAVTKRWLLGLGAYGLGRGEEGLSGVLETLCILTQVVVTCKNH